MRRSFDIIKKNKTFTIIRSTHYMNIFFSFGFVFFLFFIFLSLLFVYYGLIYNTYNTYLLYYLNNENIIFSFLDLIISRLSVITYFIVIRIIGLNLNELLAFIFTLIKIYIIPC